MGARWALVERGARNEESWEHLEERDSAELSANLGQS